MGPTHGKISFFSQFQRTIECPEGVPNVQKNYHFEDILGAIKGVAAVLFCQTSTAASAIHVLSAMPVVSYL